MKIIEQETIRNNTGRAYLVKKGQRICVSGTTIVDFVAFNHSNLRDRFDQERTKASQDKLFLTKGDFLATKTNRLMFRIVEDTYTDGTHDLEKGMCSASSYRIKAKLGKLDPHQEQPLSEVPDHGCWENLTEALKPWGIAPEDIPNPFNIFMTMEIDGKTGKLAHTAIRPSRAAHVDLEAEIDCLVGISACPDTTVGGKPVGVTIYEG
jgi:uncharacterized protein YcgI (DUF1989 family)